MTWVIPSMLFWVVLAAIPVGLHLLMRPKPQLQMLPTLRFLIRAEHKSRAMRRIQHWLLMLARIAIILLAVAVMARPKLAFSLFPHAAQANGSDDAVMLVIDDSFALGFSQGGETRLQRAQRAARTLINSFPTGTEVAWITASHATPSDFLADLAGVKEDLGALVPASSSGDLLEVLRRAIRAVKERERSRKQVFVFTDGSVRAWPEALGGEATLAHEVELFIVDVGSEDVDNAFVAAIQPIPAQPRLGQPLELNVTVAGLSPERAFTAELVVDGLRQAEQRLISPHGGSETCRFLLKGLDQGPHGGWVRISGTDTVEVDNRRYFTLNVSPPPEVLVVNGSPHFTPAQDECLYLMAALAPSGLGKRKVVQATQITTTALSGRDLRPFSTVILANVAAVEPEPGRALLRHVESGGLLVVFGGANLQAAGYSSAELSGLLPVVLTGGRAQPGAEGSRLIIPDFRPALLAPFAGGRNGDLLSPRFHAWSRATLVPSPAVTCWATFFHGDPAIARRLVGKGQVIFCAFASDAEGSELPKCACFLPLIYGLVNLGDRRPPGRLETLVMEPLILPLTHETSRPEALLIGPGPDATPRTVAVDLALRSCALEGLTEPGTYELRYAPTAAMTATATTAVSSKKNEKSEQQVAFCVNLDPAGSLLTRWSRMELQNIFQPAAVHFFNPDQQVERQLSDLRNRGKEIAQWLALAALILLTLEALAAKRYSR